MATKCKKCYCRSDFLHHLGGSGEPENTYPTLLFLGFFGKRGG